jgi:hypothetical protein
MRANLVSYGERMSTRIFAAHLRSRGVAARQHDAWRIGFTCTDDDFENGASHCVSSPSLPPRHPHRLSLRCRTPDSQLHAVCRRDSARDVPVDQTGALGQRVAEESKY